MNKLSGLIDVPPSVARNIGDKVIVNTALGWVSCDGKCRAMEAKRILFCWVVSVCLSSTGQNDPEYKYENIVRV